MKKETVEEFLARGGKIQIIPPNQPEETVPIVKVHSTPENRILSLDDGEFYFAEGRKDRKAPRKQVLLPDVIDQFNLPKDVADRLRGV